MPRSLDIQGKPSKPWPQFTEEQAAFLEEIYPARCILPGEPLEMHLRYAGAQALVQRIRQAVGVTRASVSTEGDLSDDEEEALLEAEAIRAATLQQNP